MAETVVDIIEGMRKNLAANPGLGADIKGTIQFAITGEGGGSWWIDFTRSPAPINQGSNDKPACTITMADSDFIAMVNKEANPMTLFMTGKLKVGGDMSLSMKLQSII